MMRVSVIGYGYWGPNLVRNFVEVPCSQVVAVSDLLPERLPSCEPLSYDRDNKDYREVLPDMRVDAIAIATPVSSHFELAMQALQAGKPVLLRLARSGAYYTKAALK